MLIAGLKNSLSWLNESKIYLKLSFFNAFNVYKCVLYTMLNLRYISNMSILCSYRRTSLELLHRWQKGIKMYVNFFKILWSLQHHVIFPSLSKMHRYLTLSSLLNNNKESAHSKLVCYFPRESQRGTPKPRIIGANTNVPERLYNVICREQCRQKRTENIKVLAE